MLDLTVLWLLAMEAVAMVVLGAVVSSGMMLAWALWVALQWVTVSATALREAAPTTAVLGWRLLVAEVVLAVLQRICCFLADSVLVRGT